MPANLQERRPPTSTGSRTSSYLWHDPGKFQSHPRVHGDLDRRTFRTRKTPGLKIPDMVVMAVTDEKTGEVLPKARTLATFSLQEVGGPPLDERPDATGLFSDGRFLDFSDLKNRSGQAGNFQNREQNKLHSMSVTDDGERVYVAGTTAGFYVLDSEAMARNTDAALAAGTAGCNQRSTIVSVDGVIDASKIPARRQRLHAHGRQQRPRPEGVSRVRRLGAGQGRAVSACC